jgi:methylated-DNA-[protein]-cysteine S-methyltransferase
MTFEEKIHRVVKKIPRGSVSTYKEVAKKAGRPMAFRAVGNILGKNVDPNVPCHRVIRSDGKLGGYRDGPEWKIKRLTDEGYLK